MVAVNDNAAGSLKLVQAVAAHPFASVMVTQIGPADKPTAVAVV